MKIQVLSDLHIEFWKRVDRFDELIQPADILVLAGDIDVGRTNVLRALRKFAPHYQRIIYVPGNHEYYNGLQLDGFNSKEFTDKVPDNVHLLNPGFTDIGAIRFIGGTLWSDFRYNPLAELAAKNGIADFRRIPDATPQKLQQLHEREKALFKLAYETRRDKYVVFVSHFVPDIALTHDRWGKHASLLNYYFSANLGDWIGSLEPSTWIFGHTHDRIDKMLGDTRCVSNPLGYPNENNAITPLILELP